MNKAKQMTVKTGATLTWHAIDWPQAIQHVTRLQMRIAKAVKIGKHNRVKVLQGILTHSWYAKALAIKRVTENRGKNTPGIDGQTWSTAAQKVNAIFRLKRNGYQAMPLRRIYIPKRNGKRRPLSIPTMIDRAQQALYLMALEPISESIADHHAYGFRPHRCTADAIEQCLNRIGTKRTARWVLEGDIQACFDTLSHSWLLKHVPLDKRMLTQWLKAGYIASERYFPTDLGTPQGGIISPTILVIALRGLEQSIQAAIPKGESVGTISYADDFVVTAKRKETLEKYVKPAIEAFLAQRGLQLSQEKTKITHIAQGFDFLGLTVRQLGAKVLSKPAKSRVKEFLCDIRKLIKSNRAVKTERLIYLLNQKITGWANYYRFCAAKETFNDVDHSILKMLFQWIRRRHPDKSAAWCQQRYFRQDKGRNWVFTAGRQGKTGPHIDLKEAIKVPIRRHIKIRSDANPYDPQHSEYFLKRKLNRKRGKAIIMEPDVHPVF